MKKKLLDFFFFFKFRNQGKALFFGIVLAQLKCLFSVAYFLV